MIIEDKQLNEMLNEVLEVIVPIFENDSDPNYQEVIGAVISCYKTEEEQRMALLFAGMTIAAIMDQQQEEDDDISLEELINDLNDN